MERLKIFMLTLLMHLLSPSCLFIMLTFAFVYSLKTFKVCLCKQEFVEVEWKVAPYFVLSIFSVFGARDNLLMKMHF